MEEHIAQLLVVITETFTMSHQTLKLYESISINRLQQHYLLKVKEGETEGLERGKQSGRAGKGCSYTFTVHL